MTCPVYNCPYREPSGYCRITACVRPDLQQEHLQQIRRITTTPAPPYKMVGTASRIFTINPVPLDGNLKIDTPRGFRAHSISDPEMPSRYQKKPFKDSNDGITNPDI